MSPPSPLVIGRSGLFRTVTARDLEDPEPRQAALAPGPSVPAVPEEPRETEQMDSENAPGQQDELADVDATPAGGPATVPRSRCHTEEPGTSDTRPSVARGPFSSQAASEYAAGPREVFLAPSSPKIKERRPRLGRIQNALAHFLSPDIKLILGSLQKGFIFDTPIKVACFRALLICAQVLYMIQIASPVQFRFADIFMYRIDVHQYIKYRSLSYEEAWRVEEVMTASLWLATFGIIPLAVAAAGVLIPSTSRWTMVHLPYIDCVSFAQYLPFQFLQMADPRFPGQAANWRRIMSAATMVSLAWAFLFGGSASHLSHIPASFSMALGFFALLASQIFGETRLPDTGFDGVMSVVRIVVVVLVYLALCLCWWTFFAAIRDDDPKLAAQYECKRGKGDKIIHRPGGPRPMSWGPFGKRMCNCRKCRSTYEHGADACCIWETAYEKGVDEVLMLHILLLLFWVVCPATLLLAGWRVAVPYAYSGSTVVYISGYECASAILVFVCVFLVMGIGIRASRVISEQRDRLLRDMVPREVADTLVLNFSRRQVERLQTRMGGNSIRVRPAEDASVSAPQGKKSSKGSKGSSSQQTAAGERLPTPLLSRAAEEPTSASESGIEPAVSMQRRRSLSHKGRLPVPSSTRSQQSLDRDEEDGYHPPFSLTGVPGFTTQSLAFYKEHSEVTMMFSDLVGFTTISTDLHPRVTLMTLHSMFSVLDKVSTYLDVHKYETVGDAYIVAGNLVKSDPRHRETALIMGVTLINVVRATVLSLPTGQVHLQARVGLHTGPVAAGVLGLKRRVMSLVGDTMNVASRMESNSLPLHITTTKAFWEGLPERFKGLFTKRVIDVKGKGIMETYLLDVVGRDSELTRLGLNLVGDHRRWEKVISETPGV